MPDSHKPRQRTLASTLIGLAHERINPDTLRSRVQEREQREANDTRTEAEKFLGDPPRSRSALVCGENKALES